MKLLNVICAYNEIRYLPYAIAYYQQGGIDVFVLDNYSSDGTWEWLQDHDVPSERLNTDGCFDVVQMQKARIRKYTELEPDWVIYGDADEFIITPSPLREVVDEADEGHYNSVRLTKLEFFNTGEERIRRDPRDIFFYYEKSRLESGTVERIHKNIQGVSYSGDQIIFARKYGIWNRKKMMMTEGFVLNYGGTKDEQNRIDCLRRRRKAWQTGLSRDYGWHYLEYEKRGWKWSRSELLDIRQHEAWGYLKPT